MSETILEFFESEVFGDREKEAFPLISQIDDPADLKQFRLDQLEMICREVRHFIIQTLTRTGGHLSSNLGTVELATALHYVFNFKEDRVVWDVGHQAYPHKILTGRRSQFGTLRQYKGISGFLKRDESEYDHFGAGHASTSISAALGMAAARDLKGQNHHVMAVIGDGAMTGGMAFEALNQLGYLKKKVIVILNDNDMSISPNVGAMSGYLNQIISGQFYTRTREQVEKSLKMIPGIGDKIARRAGQIEHVVKTMLVPGSLFQELGYHYVGPLNGHHVESLVKTLQAAKEVDGPVLVHVRTVKGKGFGLAEKHNETYHGVGVGYLPKTCTVEPVGAPAKKASAPSYTKVFSQTMLRLAKTDPDIVGITAAMPSGTGLDAFGKAFPDRYFDVGIAEQHAVTFAAGLATCGKKPVAAIYSTFLQRAYDQVIHDVCIQDLDVTFAMDRGGLVGADGPTHHGVFDIAYLRVIPNLVVMAPSDENELQHMLNTAIQHKGPIALRYPRGNGVGVVMDEELQTLPIGKGRILRQGQDILLVGYGPMVYTLLKAADQLAEEDISATVLDARFVKPLDLDLVLANLPANRCVLTLEDGCRQGGFGSALLEALQDAGQFDVRVVRMGIDDAFVTHGDVKLLYKEQGMDVEAVLQKVQAILAP
ncbi:MAG: 1-deoxy-D-xylulose-5-phosphate synthase [Acidobacteria bacterium]|nr:1-deoxy-D-xylulose-5-phosphate synthase [Acidobacteriota bacterium]MCB9398242.1 1-deoxy-D-xylulose-5-phosphate synthase [Acidobacteriota bacterium]